METIKTTALSRSARILRRILEICCDSHSNGKLPADDLIRECGKLAQREYKSRHNWCGKGDPLETVQ